MPVRTAHHTFRVDRLATLRNEIVHSGKLIPIMPPIPDYMQCLFIDLLRKELRVGCLDAFAWSWVDLEGKVVTSR
jgi:hypothetical protein